MDKGGSQQTSLLDVLKKKMRQAREEAEQAKDEADEVKRQLEEERKKREDVRNLQSIPINKKYSPKLTIKPWIVVLCWSKKIWREPKTDWNRQFRNWKKRLSRQTKANGNCGE